MTEEGATPKLAVGHRRQPDVFLKPDDFADGAVLHGAQLVFRHCPFTHLVPRLNQCMRAQQAADMIGVKGWGLVHSVLPGANKPMFLEAFEVTRRARSANGSGMERTAALLNNRRLPSAARTIATAVP